MATHPPKQAIRDGQMQIAFHHGRTSWRLRSLSFAASGIAVALSFASSDRVAAQDADLAKELANPLAALISVPFQFNYNQGFGPADGDQVLLNIQPVIPISLNQNWNLISRTIMPVVWQDDIAGTSGDQFGLGDTLQSAWLSPAATTPVGNWNLTWGIGGAFLIPTSTDDLLGVGLWGAGPTTVALVTQGPWTIGGLWNHVWGESGDINQTFIQPFISYTTDSAWTFALNTESTYNWNTEEWGVPINATVSKLLNFSGQPVQFQVGARYWAESTTGGADGWGGRAAITFLFPKR